MKKIFLLVLISFGFQGNAQNGALFQDWFLVSYELDEESFSVSQITPHISPNLFIEPNLEISGFAACNDYTGSFSYDSTNDLLTLTNFSATLNLCDFQTHNDFEIDYFNVLFDATFSYSIIYETNGLESLELVSTSGETLHYRNWPLIFSVNNFEFSKIYLYPNPTSNNLYISNNNLVIETISVYSISGKKVLEKNYNQTNPIDVSILPKGMYFIKISSVSGKFVKKFIKK